MVDPLWAAGFMGNASVGSATESGGVLHVAGIGQELFDQDHGFVVYRPINNDEIRVEVDFLGADAGGSSAYEKTGLILTSSLDANAPRVAVQYQPSWPGPGGSLQFRYRSSGGGSGGGTWASNVVLPLPVRVAVVKDGNQYTVEYSTDGGAHWLRPSGGAHGQVSIADGRRLAGRHELDLLRQRGAAHRRSTTTSRSARPRASAATPIAIKAGAGGTPAHPVKKAGSDPGLFALRWNGDQGCR